MWDLLRSLCGAWAGQWMVIGDFNEALWQYEHFSDTPRPERQMMDFREVLSHCDLHDLGFVGLPWTYNNNQGGSRNVRVRLDRGVANTDLQLNFPEASITHLTSSRSDHKSLLLSMQRRQRRSQGQTFRYEIIMWEREEELGVTIEKAWQRTKAELPIRHGGVAAPPSVGVAPVEPFCLPLFRRAMERRRGGRRLRETVSDRTNMERGK